MKEYTFHQLVIEANEELPANEMIQVDPNLFLEMLGDLSVRATVKYDDARQHIVWSRFPVVPVEVSDE